MKRKAPARKVSVRAEYAAAIALFCYPDDHRINLTGIFIEPHAQGGVVITASDGHRLATILDRDGSTNGSWICPVPKMIAAAALPARIMKFAGAKVSVHDGRLPVVETTAEPIDGEIPDWRSVLLNIPLAQTRAAIGVEINPKYLSDFGKAARLLGAKHYEDGIVISTPSVTGAAVVTLHKFPDFLGSVMPKHNITRLGHVGAQFPSWFFPPARRRATTKATSKRRAA